jgi:hypothetical protein
VCVQTQYDGGVCVQTQYDGGVCVQTQYPRLKNTRKEDLFK